MNVHPKPAMPPQATKILTFGLGLLFACVPLIYFGFVRGATEPKDFLAEIILFGLLALHIFKKQPLPKPSTWQDWIVALFFLTYLGSALFAENYSWSLWELNRWAALLIIYFLAQAISTKQQDKIFWVALGAGAIVSGFAIFNYYGIHFDEAIYSLSGRGRMISTFGNQNFLCAFIAPLVPLNVYLILSNPGKRNLLPYGCFALLLSTLIYAQTRGALLGLLISLLILTILTLIYQRQGWLKARYHQLATLGIISLIALGLFGGTPPFSSTTGKGLADRFSQQSLFKSQSTQTRYMLWAITADMIKDHPLKGVGIGNYGYAMPGYQKNFLARPANWHYRPDAGWAFSPHNQYLQIAAEGGLVPAGLFLALLAYLALRFFRTADRSHDNLQTICLLCSLATISIHAVVSFPLSLMSSSLLFWFVAGRVNLVLHPHSPETDSAATVSSPVLRITVLVIVIILAISALLKFAGDRYLALGNRHEIRRELVAAEKYYRISRSLNPLDWRNAERLGSVLSLQGRHEEAEKSLAIGRRTAHSDLIDNETGLNLVRQGDVEEALQTFQRGRRYFPNSFYLNRNSGLAAKQLAEQLFKSGEQQRAVTLSKQAVLYMEKALLLSPNEQERYMSGQLLVALSNTLFNQPQPDRDRTLESGEIFYFAAQHPYRHLVEEFDFGDKKRVRLFCSSPELSSAQLPPGREDLRTLPLGKARLYQYWLRTERP